MSSAVGLIETSLSGVAVVVGGGAVMFLGKWINSMFIAARTARLATTITNAISESNSETTELLDDLRQGQQANAANLHNIASIVARLEGAFNEHIRTNTCIPTPPAWAPRRND